MQSVLFAPYTLSPKPFTLDNHATAALDCVASV